MKIHINKVFLILFLSFIFQSTQAQIRDYLLSAGSDFLLPLNASPQSISGIGSGYYGNVQAYFTDNVAAQVGLEFKGAGTGPYINFYLGGVLRPSKLDTYVIFPYFSYGIGASNAIGRLGVFTFGEVGLYVSRFIFAYNLNYNAGDSFQSLRVGYGYYF